MHRFALACTVAALICFAGHLSAQTALPSPLSADLASKLASAGGRLALARFGAEFSGKLALAPATPIALEAQARLAAHKPDIMVEALYRLPAPALAKLAPAEKLLRLANRFRSVSSLEGITYFSQSHGDRRVLYTESYAVPSRERTERKDAIPDPLLSKPVDRSTQPVVQNDASFGRLLFEYEFVLGTADAGFFATNLWPLMVFIFEGVGARGLFLSAAAVPDGDSVLLYICSGARAGNLFGYQDKLKASFQNRADAVKDWLAGYLK